MLDKGLLGSPMWLLGSVKSELGRVIWMFFSESEKNIKLVINPQLKVRKGI